MIFVLRFPVNLSGDRLFTNIKSWKLSAAHMPGPLKGWKVKGKVQWGAQARTLQQDVLAQCFVDFTEFFPDTTVFTIRKLVLRTN